MADSLVVGETRIRDLDGFCGTIVYVGPVASAKNPSEIYAGIAWDDDSRGKHDGSVICRRTNQIVRHFSCGPTQGSFLRLNKMDLGVMLTAELLRSKYVELQAPVIAPNNLLPHTARTSSGRDKPIEFLGEMKIRKRQQLEDIDKVSLRREGISKASDDDMSDFSNIRHIDLAGNLLCNWTEVLKIIRQFPNLEDFSVAYNRIRDVDLPVVQLERIMVLNLNSCTLSSFHTVQWIGKSMPNLEQLCIASSDFTDMKGYKLDGFQNLKNLDCSNCNLMSWVDQVSVFKHLPKLEHLSLDDNPIPCIPKQEDSSFASLVSIQLSHTSISDWMDLEGINSMPIKSLRLKNTPLTSTMGQGEARFLAIARFPSLEYLNSSIISKQEVAEAERRYVSFVTKLLAHEGNDERKQELINIHPQYPRLKEKHKNLVVTTQEQVSGEGNNLSSTICNVTITSMSASSCGMEPLIRRLPGTLTVGRLKALCARAFGLDTDLMSLHFRTQNDAFPVELDNDDNNLNYYGVCDGAEILMNEIDLNARREESRKMAEEQDKKIKDQERDILAMEEFKRQNKRS